MGPQLMRTLLCSTLTVLACMLTASNEAHAQTIKCGAVLGPGGKYVLDRDLVCPPSSNGIFLNGVLNVFGGATLHLNGHTVTCSSGGWGIVVRDATVKKGTVRGCDEGVISIGGVVKRMTADANEVGIHLWSGLGFVDHGFPTGNSIAIGNTATNNEVGFLVRYSTGDTLVENTAIQNGTGFVMQTRRFPGPVLIRNTAVRNVQSGYAISGPNQIVGNAAEQNAVGFNLHYEVFGNEVRGNVARANTGAGFSMFLSQPVQEILAQTRENVAEGNGGDGFAIEAFPFSGTAPGTPLGSLTGNYALGNFGRGIRVGQVGPAQGVVNATVTKNTALGNAAADLADDTNCRWLAWIENRFATAEQTCID